ncbi:hypothetical protein, partial [Tannerella forsythia]|uniref:hypothetical protein n=1 Tax=Tannerella forsythia TaxID=28112 RepID=UPI00241C1EB5
ESYAKHASLFKQNISTIKRINILYQAYSPLQKWVFFFPQRFATHWAELTHPFGAVTVVSYQLLSSQLSANNSTTQQSNNPTPEGLFLMFNCVLFSDIFKRNRSV